MVTTGCVESKGVFSMKKIQAWGIVVKTLLAVKERAIVGAKLSDLDAYAESIIKEYGGTPINKGYPPEEKWQAEVRPTTPFPNTLVCNVNSVVAHGNATDYELRDGDTVVFDLGVKYDGLSGDAALTVLVGNVENHSDRLVRYARLTTLEGIKKIKAGASLAEVGKAMEHYASMRGYVINQTFASHAIGKEMHEDPIIQNYYVAENEEVFFEEGRMYCIEPILTYKDIWGMRAFNDWAWVTRDGKRCAMFEHQVLVTKDGCKILTKDLF